MVWQVGDGSTARGQDWNATRRPQEGRRAIKNRIGLPDYLKTKKMRLKRNLGPLANNPIPALIVETFLVKLALFHHVPMMYCLCMYIVHEASNKP